MQQGRRLRAGWIGAAAGLLVGASLVPPVSAEPKRRSDRGRIAELEARVAKLEAALDEAMQVLQYVHVEEERIHGLSGPHVIFEGVNVHIRSGSGVTDERNEPTGLGNLIVGYNEDRGTGGRNPRSGSHNVVIGPGHAYTASGGLVAGDRNEVSGPGASVTGGKLNRAQGRGASVSGGFYNWATGDSSWIGGGNSNEAGPESSVVGGGLNYAGGPVSSVLGGSENTAEGELATVVGGRKNVATGRLSSVLGGGVDFFRDALDEGNVAWGNVSTVCGGTGNLARRRASSVAGGTKNVAADVASSVSGGSGRVASGEASWAAGSLFEPN